MLPKIDIGDYLFIHDAGAHGFSMGYNYNGKLRSAEPSAERRRKCSDDQTGGDPFGLLRNI